MWAASVICLQELSKDTQFIIITHNRNTVQAADVIYGITMGRDSASQIISLRLDQVTDEMLKAGRWSRIEMKYANLIEILSDKCKSPASCRGGRFVLNAIIY